MITCLAMNFLGAQFCIFFLVVVVVVVVVCVWLLVFPFCVCVGLLCGVVCLVSCFVYPTNSKTESNFFFFSVFFFCFCVKVTIKPQVLVLAWFDFQIFQPRAVEKSLEMKCEFMNGSKHTIFKAFFLFVPWMVCMEMKVSIEISRFLFCFFLASVVSKVVLCAV